MPDNDRLRALAYMTACKMSEQAEQTRRARAAELPAVIADLESSRRPEAAETCELLRRIVASIDAKCAVWEQRRAALRELVRRNEAAAIAWEIAAGHSWRQIAAAHFMSVNTARHRAIAGYAAVCEIIPPEWSPEK